jgi:hypothetical protein
MDLGETFSSLRPHLNSWVTKELVTAETALRERRRTGGQRAFYSNDWNNASINMNFVVQYNDQSMEQRPIQRNLVPII